MWNEENNNKVNVNYVEIDGDISILPVAQDDEFEREIVEKRSAVGRVRWFSRSRGYGFLREDVSALKDPDEINRMKDREIFVHQHAIQVPGEKNLRPGQRVLFELCRLDDNENGKIMALNVIPIREQPQEL